MMDKFVLFLLFVRTIQVESNWSRIGKCCANDEMLSLSESGAVECKLIANSDVEGLFYFGPVKPYLQTCPQNVTKIDIHNDFIDAQKVNCIDVFELDGGPPPHRHVLSGIQLDRKCAGKHKFPKGNVNKVKKTVEPFYLCCKANEKFDLETRKCVSIIDDYGRRKNVSEIVQLVKGRSDFLTVYDGGIICSNTMVDYFVQPSDFIVEPDGIPKVNLNLSVQMLLSRDQKYCLDKTTVSGTFILKLCREKDYCQNNACIRKCSIYNEGNDSFYETRETIDSFHALIMRANSTSLSQFKDSLLKKNEYGITAPSLCQHMFPIFRKWQLLSNGYIQVSNLHESYNQDEYCLDFRINENAVYSAFLYVCRFKNTNILGLVEGSSKLISFTIQTIILIFYVTSSQSENLQAKFLTSYLIGYVISDFLQAINILFEMDGALLCSNKIYLVYCSNFFHFLWLTAMCYYGWRETRRNTYAVYSSARSSDDKSFFSGTNVLILTVSVFGTLMLILLDHLEIMPKIIRPNCRDCIWFDKQYIYGKVIFYLTPITFLLLLNITYFALTTRNLYYTNIDRHLINNIPNFRNYDRYELNKNILYQNVELFFLTIVPFVIETGGEIVSYIRPEFFGLYAAEYYLVYSLTVVNLVRCFELFYSLMIKPKLCHSVFRRIKSNTSQLQIK